MLHGTQLSLMISAFGCTGPSRVMLRHLLFLSFALGCVAVLPAGQLYCPLTDNACSVQCAAPPPAGFSGAGGYDGSSYFFTDGAAGTCTWGGSSFNYATSLNIPALLNACSSSSTAPQCFCYTGGGFSNIANNCVPYPPPPPPSPPPPVPPPPSPPPPSPRPPPPSTPVAVPSSAAAFVKPTLAVIASAAIALY